MGQLQKILFFRHDQVVSVHHQNAVFHDAPQEEEEEEPQTVQLFDGP